MKQQAQKMKQKIWILQNIKKNGVNITQTEKSKKSKKSIKMKQKNEIKNKMQITSLVKMKPQQIRKNRTLNNTNTNQIIMKN